MLMIKSFYWFFFDKERYNNYKTLKWLIKAKRYYIKHECDGMCRALANTNKHTSFLNIINVIPEYYPEFFETKVDSDGYWWKHGDIASRIDAFDKLIRIYKLKLRK